jgi:hypothetical protein
VIELDVRVDIKKAQLFLRATKEGTARATSRALNRTATTVRAEAARMIQEKRALNISVIKKAMRINRATTKRLEAAVVVSGRPISIRHFSSLGLARTNGKVTGITGISARILRGGPRRLLMRHGNKAFTNPKLGGGLAIAYRTGKSRLPISSWAPVPGLPTVLVQSKIVAAIRKVVAEVFPKRLKEEMNYEINVAKRRAR